MKRASPSTVVYPDSVSYAYLPPVFSTHRLSKPAFGSFLDPIGADSHKHPEGAPHADGRDRSSSSCDDAESVAEQLRLGSVIPFQAMRKCIVCPEELLVVDVYMRKLPVGSLHVFSNVIRNSAAQSERLVTGTVPILREQFMATMGPALRDCEFAFGAITESGRLDCHVCMKLHKWWLASDASSSTDVSCETKFVIYLYNSLCKLEVTVQDVVGKALCTELHQKTLYHSHGFKSPISKT